MTHLHRHRACGRSSVTFLYSLLAVLLAPLGDALAATQTFCNSSGITIPQFGSAPILADPYPSTISVSGLSNPLNNRRVRVKLNGLSHNERNDLNVMVVSPSGKGVTLLSGVWHDWGTLSGDYTFCDTANQYLFGYSISGLYHPDTGLNGATFASPAPAPTGDLLSAFNGLNPNGTWKLFVADDSDYNSGSIASWCLEFGDYVMDPISFAPVTDATPGAYVTSETVSVTGIKGAVPISILSCPGGDCAYSTNGWFWTSDPYTVDPSGMELSVRVKAPLGYSVSTAMQLRVGSTTLTFNVTTAARDTAPDAFSFSPAFADPAVATVSNAIALSGMNAATTIVINKCTGTACAYRLDGGSWQTGQTTYNPGQVIEVRQTASPTPGATTQLDLLVGGIIGSFQVTTKDTAPDPFAFTPQSGVTPGTRATSNGVSITGINQYAPVHIVSCDTSCGWSTGGGYFVSGDGSVSTGFMGMPATLWVAQTASGTPSTTTHMVLDVGGVQATFTVTSGTSDTSPDAFSFDPQVNVPVSTVATSNAITVSGIDAPAPIAIGNCSSACAYRINGGGWTSSAGTVASGQTVEVQLMSAATTSATTQATLDVGGVTATFSVATVDTQPDPFGFTSQSNVARSAQATSNSVTLSGFSAATNIAIASCSGGGCEYRIGSGGWTSAPGLISSGQSVTVRQTASASYGTTTVLELDVGGEKGSFSVRTEDDTVPDAFAFMPKTGAALSIRARSNPVTVSGITGATPISIVSSTGNNPVYRINGGTWRANAGTVNPGNTVEVRIESAATYETTTQLTLSIGGVTAVYSVTTAAMDTVPAPFGFTPAVNVPLGTPSESDLITVTGINAPTSIRIAGCTGTACEYSIDGGTWSSADATVTSGQTVAVRQTSALLSAATTELQLDIGGEIGSYQVTTADIAPDAFGFTPVTGAAPGALVASEAVTVGGITIAVPISISACTDSSCEYRIDGGSWGATAATIANGQKVEVRQQAAATESTTRTLTLTIGEGSGSFSVRTLDDTVPDAFVFNAQRAAPAAQVVSNKVTVAGVSAPAPISISACGASQCEYRIDDGAWSQTAATVGNGQAVDVRQTAAATPSTATTLTLAIGGVTGDFTVTTADDTTPDAFTFAPQRAALAAQVVSNKVTIAGLSAPAPISIAACGATQCEYRVDDGAWSQAAATVGNGQTVDVRQTAAATHSTATTLTLAIGGVSGDFTVTTVDDTTPDPFGFAPITGVEPGAVATSEVVTVHGLTGAAPVTLLACGGSGCGYRIDGGAWTSAAGSVREGQQIQVRQTAAAAISSATTLTLGIGDVQGVFSVTTRGDRPLDGSCGPAAGVATLTVPTAGLCASGQPSAVKSAGGHTWSCAGTAGGATVSCTAPGAASGGNPDKRVTLALLEGPGCSFVSATTTAPPEGGPAGITMPYGAVAFTLQGCTGGSARVQIGYAGSVQAMRFWKHAAGNWTELREAIMAANTVAFTLVDNGPYDDDPAEGVIRDPGGVGYATAAVPAFTPWGLGLLAVLVSLLGMRAPQRRN